MAIGRSCKRFASSRDDAALSVVTAARDALASIPIAFDVAVASLALYALPTIGHISFSARFALLLRSMRLHCLRFVFAAEAGRVTARNTSVICLLGMPRLACLAQ